MYAVFTGLAILSNGTREYFVTDFVRTMGVQSPIPTAAFMMHFRELTLPINAIYI